MPQHFIPSSQLVRHLWCSWEQEWRHYSLRIFNQLSKHLSIITLLRHALTEDIQPLTGTQGNMDKAERSDKKSYQLHSSEQGQKELRPRHESIQGMKSPHQPYANCIETAS